MFFKRELDRSILLLTTLKSFENIVFFAPNSSSDLVAFKLDLRRFDWKNLSKK